MLSKLQRQRQNLSLQLTDGLITEMGQYHTIVGQLRMVEMFELMLKDALAGEEDEDV